ncbi:metallophosphoesterase family protein [Solirubrobacter sp. CPCC 204708]|uniref:Phosphoesterase n=1 Tax=Solirubrobacter deserti TaxID=2282478 RepID=A0ABT4RGU8_9ACTN|nr:metallophosphoesterase family protein [Solirubrobacter deserti]MBE2315397.1 metallophosphoesterase family protein [Solirubrobacter deserti]MDA0137759.1 metallophosphatase family protein [Solirubrobacter deserti]
MLLAVISDTHMPLGKRRLPVEHLVGADAILHAGDFSARSVLEELQTLGPPVHAVRGNVEDPWIHTHLPLQRTLEFAGVRIGMIHDAGPAAGRLARLRRRFRDEDAVIFGHSHIPLHETAEDGFQIFNPGSPTEKRRQPKFTMGYARVDDRTVTFELVELG